MFALIFFSIFMLITLRHGASKTPVSNPKRQGVLFHEPVGPFSAQFSPADACLPSFVFVLVSFSPNAGPQ
jgi:hypothetical protein